MTSSTISTWGSRGWKLALVTGAFLMLVAALLGSTSRNILNPSRFGANIAAALGDDRVAAYVADHLTDAIIAKKPDLVTIRPLLLSSVRAIVASEPFRAAVRTSARSAHRFFFEEAGSRLVFSLPDIGTVVRSALAQASPELAAKIPPGIEAQLTSGKAERAISTFLRLWKLGDRLLLAAWITWYVGIALLVLGIALAPDRRRGVAEAGLALIAIAVAFLAVVPTLRLVMSAAFPDPAVAGFVHGIIKAFLSRLRVIALVVGLPGLVLLAAGTAYLERVDPLELARRLGRLVATPPVARWPRLGWALGLLLAGTVALVWPTQLLIGAVVLLGIGLLHGGLREIFGLIIGNLRGESVASRALERSRWPIVAGAAVIMVGLGGAGAWLLRSERSEPVIAATKLCNGSAILCDRTVDQIVFPTAHNAFSNTSVSDWMFPHHLRSMPQMLEDGVRGMLLDIHYGVPAGGKVKTAMEDELASEFGFSSNDKIAEAIGEEAVAVAMRIRDRLVAGKDAERGIYFCHGFCEIGAYPVTPTLKEIRDWVVANPGEVIVLSIEDYVEPAEIDGAFIASGLVDFVYSGSVTPWPTLRELIATDQRVIVLLESGHAGPAYLHPGFEIMSETQYSFRTPEDFNCRPNRGTGDSLFMMNHWIETTPTPKPSNAAIVNAYDVLLARARQCQQERGHIPNLIAVDFAGIGDLLRVARTLNGLDSETVAGAPGFELLRVIEVAGRQGIATDGERYYVSGSRSLYVYDKQGTLLASNETPFDALEAPANHIGDISVHRGELYAGVEQFLDGAAGDIRIAVYDARTLTYLRSIDWNPASGQREVSGVAVDPATDTLWMTDWIQGDRVYRYSLSDGTYVGSVRIDPPPPSQQGIAVHAGFLYITADDGDAERDEPDGLFRVTVDPGASVGHAVRVKSFTEFRRAGEIEGLDFDAAAREMVVLSNRGSHIVQGMPQGFLPGYDREIHELYVYRAP